MSVIKEKLFESPETEIVKREKKLMLQVAHMQLEKKNAIAKVWIKKGNGKITVNDHEALKYFGGEILVNITKAPLAQLN